MGRKSYRREREQFERRKRDGMRSHQAFKSRERARRRRLMNVLFVLLLLAAFAGGAFLIWKFLI